MYLVEDEDEEEEEVKVSVRASPLGTEADIVLFIDYQEAV